MRRVIDAAVVALVSVFGVALGSFAQEVPEAARARGFIQNTFSTERFSDSNIDESVRVVSGGRWYGWSFFKKTTDPEVDGISINSDGSITIGAGSISSAVRSNSFPFFRGVAFGGGGYFEAELKFDHHAAHGRTQWPAWWAMSVEHLAQMPPPFGRWPNQAGEFEHFGEIDFFEYNTGFGRKHNEYGATLHDWYGVYGKNCSAYCVKSTGYRDSTISVPVDVNWMKYHRFGGALGSG